MIERNANVKANLDQTHLDYQDMIATTDELHKKLKANDDALLERVTMQRDDAKKCMADARKDLSNVIDTAYDAEKVYNTNLAKLKLRAEKAENELLKLKTLLATLAT